MSSTEPDPDLELKQLNDITERVIGCAIEVHRALGPGLLERTYEEAMCLEMDRRNIQFVRQALYPVSYKQVPTGEHRIDLVVEDAVVSRSLCASVGSYGITGPESAASV